MRAWHSSRLPFEQGTASLPPFRRTFRFLCRGAPMSPRRGTIDPPAILFPIPVHVDRERKPYEGKTQRCRPSERRATAATPRSEGLDLRSTRIARETALPPPSTVVRGRFCRSVRGIR